MSCVIFIYIQLSGGPILHVIIFCIICDKRGKVDHIPYFDQETNSNTNSCLFYYRHGWSDPRNPTNYNKKKKQALKE
jgi:hypothetical protein